MHFLFLTNIKCNRRHSKVMQSSTLCVFCVFHQRAVLDYILGDICCDGTHLMELSPWVHVRLSVQGGIKCWK